MIARLLLMLVLETFAVMGLCVLAAAGCRAAMRALRRAFEKRRGRWQS